MTRFLSFLCVLLILNSCSFFRKDKEPDKNKGKLLAKVYDSYLYERDLKGLITNPTTHEDSLLIRTHFIENWVKDQLIYYKALKNLTTEEKDKSEELNNYYQSLMRYEYEEKMIRQRLDTVVSNEEIEAYFNNNKQQFALRKCIIRLMFLKIPVNAPEIPKVRQWITTKTDKDIDFLYQYCRGYAMKFSLEDKKWYYLDDLVNDIPLDPYSCDLFSARGKMEFNDSSFIYLLNITDYRREGDLPPIEFEKDRIKNTIIHIRRIELLKKIEEGIFKEGMEKRNVKIYE